MPNPPDNWTPRARTLTDADIAALRDLLVCSQCSFSSEEVQFVKDWMETAKTAKSEVIKWIVQWIMRGIIYVIIGGSAIFVAVKMGWNK